jgi:hypothetical protein
MNTANEAKREMAEMVRHAKARRQTNKALARKEVIGDLIEHFNGILSKWDGESEDHENEAMAALDCIDALQAL